MTKGRLGVFLTRGYLDSVPSLRDGLSLLAEHGYSVDVWMPIESHFNLPEFDSNNIRVHGLRRYNGHGKRSWVWNMVRWAWHSWLYAGRQHYSCLLGVDAEGLLLATIVGFRQRTPIVYYSLEILCASDKKSYGLRLVKTVERMCHRRALFTVIQDEARATLLSSENRVHGVPNILIPNAPRGQAKRYQSNLLRGKLGIAQDRLLILHAGSIARWTMSMELAEAAQSWPDEWVLVFQCREQPCDDYGRRVMALADGHKIIVSAEPVPSQRFSEVVASADIGIALYGICDSHPILGKNLYTLGKSSGKIAYYLQAGIPVVVSDLPSVRSYIERRSAGVCVSDVTQIRPAIETILAKYPYYSANALHCFQQEFDLERHFVLMIEQLNLLIAQRAA